MASTTGTFRILTLVSKHFRYGIIYANGEMAEWSKAPDSKSGLGQPNGGSNPSLSATFTNAPHGAFSFQRKHTMQTYNNYIAGEWIAGRSQTPNRNPSNLSDVIGEHAQADLEQAKQ